MAKNRKHEEGRYIEMPVPEGTVSGDALVIEDMPCVALIDRRDDGKATVQRDGVYFFDVKGVDKAGEAALKAGQIVFLQEDGTVTANEDGKRFGYLQEDVVKNKTENVPVVIGF